eukprot:CAMPEP_0172324662 /NCGR_PEP_ID=MMETSP1058-20130122/51915_1 /TAXON_ID=83371 /ORGANISM="Detonula confervacea, Strain CCMP 353" /LENGTH=44 /DNA_ID= /DNA_START= /DNA_END= /DNA_ORIENTATION=
MSSFFFIKTQAEKDSHIFKVGTSTNEESMSNSSTTTSTHSDISV